jgi:hypothetical protein
MFDPAQLTLGQVSSVLRDFTVVGVLLTLSWKSRGVYEAAKNFFKRLTTHMELMERGMNTLLTNHLAHIETSLKQMTRHQIRATDAEQVQYELEDEAGQDNASEF